MVFVMRVASCDGFSFMLASYSFYSFPSMIIGRYPSLYVAQLWARMFLNAHGVPVKVRKVGSEFQVLCSAPRRCWVRKAVSL